MAENVKSVSVLKPQKVCLLPQEEWNSKYGQLKVCCFDASDTTFCFGSLENKSLTIVETITNFSATFILPSEPTHAVISVRNNYCAFGLSSGFVGIIFDLDESKLSNKTNENVRLFDSLESLKITFIKTCNRERSFYVATNLGIVSKFACRGCEEVEITRILELDSPIVEISLSEDDTVLVVSTEIRTLVCDNSRKTFHEAGNKPRNGIFGAVPLKNATHVICSRPGSRLWKTDLEGKVLNTFQFKKTLQTQKPSQYLDEEIPSDSKIVSYTKSGQNVIQPSNFTRLLLIQDSKFVMTFNKQSIYIFDVENLQSVEYVHRRFGLFKDVFVDHSNIYVKGSVDTISKFKISAKTFDEPDFVSKIEAQHYHRDEVWSSDNEEYFSDTLPYDVTKEFSNNFSSTDFSHISTVDLSDISNSAAAASLFLSEKITVETRKLLNIATDRMKQTKLNSMIEQMVEQSVEQKRILDTKDKILEIALHKPESSSTKQTFLSLLCTLEKNAFKNNFEKNEAKIVQEAVTAIIKEKIHGQFFEKLPTRENQETRILAPATLEALNLIYGTNSRHNLDVEICNFITDSYHLIQPDKLYQDLPEGFYHTWASIVSQAKSENENSNIGLTEESTIFADENSELYLTSQFLSEPYNKISSEQFFSVAKPFQIIYSIFLQQDILYLKDSQDLVKRQSKKKNHKDETSPKSLDETMTIYFSKYSKRNELRDWIQNWPALLPLFKNSFIKMRPQTFQEETKIDKLGFILLDLLIEEECEKEVLDFCIESKFWSGFTVALNHCQEETKWTHLSKVFEIVKLETLTDLGYLCSEESCSRLIEAFLNESTKKEINISLEQIAYKMIESIGAENSMKILMKKSPKFEKGTFSARFYKHLIEKSLAERRSRF